MTIATMIADCFGVPAARALVIRPLGREKIVVVHLDQAYGEGARPVILPADDAFLVMLYFADVEHCDIGPGRRPQVMRLFAEGSICLISLKAGAAISIRGRLDALAFHIPAGHFEELAAEAGAPPVGGLTTCRGKPDPVVHNIGAALMPMFDMPEEVRDALLPHLGLAFNAHLAHRYGFAPAGA